MKKTTRIVTIALAIVLLPVLNLSAGGEQPAVKATEVMEITWIGETQAGMELAEGSVPEDSWVGQQLKKKFPEVRIIPVNVEQSNVDLLKILVHSGDMPDFGYYDRVQGETWNFYKDGATRSIPHDMIKEYAPNMAKWYDDRPPAWLLYVVPGTDEKYALPGLKDYKLGVMYLPFFRYDWLEKIGMQPPSVIDLEPEKDPGKYLWGQHRYGPEELEAILKAFRDADFDGNGKDDTVPWALDQRFWNWRSLHGIYGLVWGWNIEENGQTVLAEVSEAAKAYTKLMQKWYKMKLINSDFPNVTSSQVRAFMHEGIAGVGIGAYSHLGIRDASPKWPQALLANNDGSKLVMMDPFKGTAGFKSGVESSVQSSSWVFRTIVAERVSNEKLAKCLEIYDYLNGTLEGHVMSIYGEPGMHFEWAGEPFNSYVERKGPFTTKDAMGGKEGFRFYQGGNHFPIQWMVFRDDPFLSDVIERYRDKVDESQLALYMHREDLFGETEYQNLRKKYSGDLDTIRDEFFYKAVTGQIDVDSEWNSYVKKYMGAGGDELLAEIKKAPLVSGLKQGKKTY